MDSPIELIDPLRIIVSMGLFILIWLVQLIIYPSFAFAAVETFTQWHKRYTGLITIFVAPLMLLQTTAFAWQAFFLGRWHDWVGFALVVTCWIATFCLSVPCHDALQRQGYDLKIIKRLVRTNWIRTAAWTAVFVLDASRYC